MVRQRTLGKSVETFGIGLHTGLTASLALHPAPAGSGVIFRRIDLDPMVEIPARWQYVADTTLSTTLERDGARIGTVEHLLAALSGVGVDNALVDVSGPEVPIMDGSAAPFVHLIRAAGVRELEAPRQYLRVLREVSVSEGDRRASFLPFEGFKVSFTIDFDQPFMRRLAAHAELDFAHDSFADAVSAARTFGFAAEVEALRSRGLARGGSLDNAVVVDDDRVLNRGGLRSDDELVKHKVLDAIGDLALIGCRLLGEFRAFKSGHALNNAAVRALLASGDAWQSVTLEEAPSGPWRREF